MPDSNRICIGGNLNDASDYTLISNMISLSFIKTQTNKEFFVRVFFLLLGNSGLFTVIAVCEQDNCRLENEMETTTKATSEKTREAHHAHRATLRRTGLY